ncbi:MAG: type I restriction enzyme HsdR N-terminal domain-containing protein [Candidatus Poribacteria bacterium]|nr:type I restriction enzyme HsdR N-terminal domain-containing protein [Candidatus Poribacteria bacterium]
MRDLETVLCRLHSRSQPRYPRFTLCPECRTEASHEVIVVEAVVNYFSKPEFKELFIQTEHEIQMGTSIRRSDILLLDSAENFVVIAECKRIGYVNTGIAQLKSYLCATDTPFGMFANSTDPDDWEFYENLRRNRFKEITHNQFKARIGVALPIELVPKRENRFKSGCTSQSRFARRREKARRANCRQKI